MASPDLARLTRRLDEQDDTVRAVSDTMLDIKETVDEHTETLAQHTETLAQHTEALTTIQAAQAQHGELLTEILRRLGPGPSAQ